MPPGDLPSLTGRRTFLRAGLAAVLPLLAAPAAARAGAPAAGGGVQDSLAGRGEVGTLSDPTVLGRPRLPTDPLDNAVEIQAIEQRLACDCGCTLDVFTCRTTEFSCTYAPALHREVLALGNQGLSAEEILDAFVAKYGEKALMAPKPNGVFNLAGYLAPGVLIAVAGVALVAMIGRRRTALAAAVGGEGAASAAPEVAASTAELERLQRALSEVED